MQISDNSTVEPILKILCLLMVFFTVVLISVDYLFKGEGQVFQVVSSVLAGVTGAFLARINPHQNPPPGPTVQGDNSGTIIAPQPAPKE